MPLHSLFLVRCGSKKYEELMGERAPCLFVGHLKPDLNLDVGFQPLAI